MLAVLVRAEQPDVFAILMTLLNAFIERNAYVPAAKAPFWEDIRRFELEDAFWSLMERTFAYRSENPNLADLMRRLLVTDLSRSLNTNLPQGLEHFRLQSKSQAQNASVFLSQWRKDIGFYPDYDKISGHFSKELGILEQLKDCSEDELVDVVTFECIEQAIIRSLRDKIQGQHFAEFERLEDIIQKRKDGHWAHTSISGKRNPYRLAYEALQAAIDMLRLRRQYDHGFSYATVDELAKAYTDELFVFDQTYRHFMEAADEAAKDGGDLLKSLREAIDDLYSNWYLRELADRWDEFLTHPTDGFVNYWSLSQVPNQYRFFKNFVEPSIQRAPKSKVFVIISDAFRYEAAEELTSEINAQYRFKAELSSMLSVLPSYTMLGMAALLPHKSLTYKGKSVLVDDKASGGIKERLNILSQHKGIAIKAQDLLEMKKEEGREFVRPYQIIYIYHNEIDARGDKAASESQAFKAVRDTIEDLKKLSRYIIDSLNGSTIYLTADHGFIFECRPPEETDKSKLDSKPSGVVHEHKRFILGEKLGETEKAITARLAVTAGIEGEMECWVPKGTNRFSFQGGSRFFHGGAMPQEVLIPLVTIRELRGKERERSQVSQVGVSLLGTAKKIVLHRHKFDFIQTDPVSERMKPRQLLISIQDGNEPISNQEKITFDSTSDMMDERKKSVRFELKKVDYNSKKDYYLVLRDAESLIEYDRIPVTIDISFHDDF